MNLPCLLKIKEDFEHQVSQRAPSLLYITKTMCLDIELTVFCQMWGSTALGFEGIGGQAMEAAYTTIIWDDCYNIWGVYFGEKLAYIIKDPNQEFMEDVFKHRAVESVSGRGKYVRKGDDA